eukprot:6937-Heterococcus_DN1.PRE.2
MPACVQGDSESEFDISRFTKEELVNVIKLKLTSMNNQRAPLKHRLSKTELRTPEVRSRSPPSNSST